MSRECLNCRQSLGWRCECPEEPFVSWEESIQAENAALRAALEACVRVIRDTSRDWPETMGGATSEALEQAEVERLKAAKP